VLEASPEELEEIKGIGPHNVFGIRLVQEASREFLKERMKDKPVLKSSQEVFDYLYHSMRGLKKEVFKVLLLNSQSQLIEAADLFKGTVNSSSVYPREVIEKAIRCNATSLIFVHNHPSGNPNPSRSDKELTRELLYAASTVGIKVLDHLIIGDNCHFSFAGEGLTRKYEDDYLNLKIKSALTHEGKSPHHSNL